MLERLHFVLGVVWAKVPQTFHRIAAYYYYYYYYYYYCSVIKTLQS